MATKNMRGRELWETMNLMISLAKILWSPVIQTAQN